MDAHIPILVLPLLNCVASGRLLDLSVPQLLHLNMGAVMPPVLLQSRFYERTCAGVSNQCLVRCKRPVNVSHCFSLS